jgi:tRNA (guanine10-N2)-methyltransferase
MEVLNNSAQPLSMRYMRRLITMTKVKPFDSQESAAWRQSLEGVQLPIDKLHDVVYGARQSSGKKGKKARYRGKCQ